jgi:hypothetical protein
MIRVNLLPQEYRKTEATPLKQFFAVIAAAVIAALSAVAWLWVHFGMLEQARSELSNVEGAVAAQQGDLKRVADLKSWVGEYESQYEKIDLVAKQRIVWSRKFDELWENVVQPNPANRYEVWLKNISCQVQPAAKSGGSVQFSGTSAGAKFARLADFHEDLKKSEFYKDFQSFTYPYGTREELGGKNRDPKEGWTFNFALELKPLTEIHEARQKQMAEKK